MPNQRTPQITMRLQSPRAGRLDGRSASSPPSATLATSSRASASGPPARSSPAARMPTKADAHRTTVTSAAASASFSVEVRPARSSVTVTVPTL